MDMTLIKQVQKELADTYKDVFPRNIVEYCLTKGIKVQETDSFPNDISGLIFKENEEYTILINSNQSIGRKAFTIAHELGHFFLHKGYLDNKEEIVSFAKGSYNECPSIPRSTIVNNKDAQYRKMEVEANEFAAQILMPDEEFLNKCKELDSIDDVARYFGVSISAATIRADRLGGLYFL